MMNLKHLFELPIAASLWAEKDAVKNNTEVAESRNSIYSKFFKGVIKKMGRML